MIVSIFISYVALYNGCLANMWSLLLLVGQNLTPKELQLGNQFLAILFTSCLHDPTVFSSIL